LFSTERTFEVELPDPEGTKVVAVRFPTDDEWIKRSKRRKTIIKDLGRGRSTTDTVGGEKVDAEIFEAIRKDAAVTIEPEEAMVLLDWISTCDVVSAERKAGEVIVTLRLGDASEVEYTMRCPSLKECVTYKRSVGKAYDLQYGQREIIVDISASSKFFDSLLKSVNGYEEGSKIPIIHKTVAVRCAVDKAENVMADRSIDFF
jgi:hypothetical protein